MLDLLEWLNCNRKTVHLGLCTCHIFEVVALKHGASRCEGEIVKLMNSINHQRPAKQLIKYFLGVWTFTGLVGYCINVFILFYFSFYLS
jgi:hypothetical protein